MATITLQVLEGMERGKVFTSLETPVTIGREVSNSIALNDESISRYHAKIQDDGGRTILTDLGSTNGTRVNGHPVQLKVLQPGDHVHVGRCILLYGSFREIDEAMGLKPAAASQSPDELGKTTQEPFRLQSESPTEGDEAGAEQEGGLDLFPGGCPSLPDEMTLVQRAQISDLLAFMHNRLVHLLAEAVEDESGEERFVRIPWPAWQRILRTEMELAQALMDISEPG